MLERLGIADGKKGRHLAAHGEILRGLKDAGIEASPAEVAVIMEETARNAWGWVPFDGKERGDVVWDVGKAVEYGKIYLSEQTRRGAIERATQGNRRLSEAAALEEQLSELGRREQLGRYNGEDNSRIDRLLTQRLGAALGLTTVNRENEPVPAPEVTPPPAGRTEGTPVEQASDRAREFIIQETVLTARDLAGLEDENIVGLLTQMERTAPPAVQAEIKRLKDALQP